MSRKITIKIKTLFFGVFLNNFKKIQIPAKNKICFDFQNKQSVGLGKQLFFYLGLTVHVPMLCIDVPLTMKSLSRSQEARKEVKKNMEKLEVREPWTIYNIHYTH